MDVDEETSPQTHEPYQRRGNAYKSTYAIQGLTDNPDAALFQAYSDGTAIVRDRSGAEELKEPFDATWIASPPDETTDADQWKVYSAYKTQARKEQNALDASGRFTVNWNDILQARQMSLERDPTYSFLQLLAGALNEASPELLQDRTAVDRANKALRNRANEQARQFARDAEYAEYNRAEIATIRADREREDTAHTRLVRNIFPQTGSIREEDAAQLATHLETLRDAINQKNFKSAVKFDALNDDTDYGRLFEDILQNAFSDAIQPGVFRRWRAIPTTEQRQPLPIDLDKVRQSSAVVFNLPWTVSLMTPNDSTRQKDVAAQIDLGAPRADIQTIADVPPATFLIDLRDLINSIVVFRPEDPSIPEDKADKAVQPFLGIVWSPTDRAGRWQKITAAFVAQYKAQVERVMEYYMNPLDTYAPTSFTPHGGLQAQSEQLAVDAATSSIRDVLTGISSLRVTGDNTTARGPRALLLRQPDVMRSLQPLLSSYTETMTRLANRIVPGVSVFDLVDLCDAATASAEKAADTILRGLGSNLEENEQDDNAVAAAAAAWQEMEQDDTVFKRWLRFVRHIGVGPKSTRVGPSGSAKRMITLRKAATAAAALARSDAHVYIDLRIGPVLIQTAYMYVQEFVQLAFETRHSARVAELERRQAEAEAFVERYATAEQFTKAIQFDELRLLWLSRLEELLSPSFSGRMTISAKYMTAIAEAENFLSTTRSLLRRNANWQFFSAECILETTEPEYRTAKFRTVFAYLVAYFHNQNATAQGYVLASAGSRTAISQIADSKIKELLEYVPPPKSWAQRKCPPLHAVSERHLIKWP
jgi:hypothetical protein